MALDIVRDIVKILNQQRYFLITSHINPDGDAVGSMGAMYYILKELNKEVFLYNISGIPERFSYLKFFKHVSMSLDRDDYDCVIFLDCGDASRAGGEINNVKKNIIINIDHHPTNDYFGDINWVDINMSSVGEMVSYIAEEIGLELKGDIAQAIYTAIVSDTGSFTFSNTRVSTLETVTKILENGFDLDEFNRNYQRYWSINKVHLHGKAMQRARLLYGGKLAMISIPRDLLSETGASVEDCEGIINYIRQIKGVKVAAVLREDQDKVKVSLRSWGEVDVSKVAVELGGGGHKNAAGGSIFSKIGEAHRGARLREAEQVFLNCIEKYIT